jgi:hypothetical protein
VGRNGDMVPAAFEEEDEVLRSDCRLLAIGDRLSAIREAL